MANLKQIQTKIRSVANLKKITRALEVVSTIKLQKTKDKADMLKNYLIDLMLILNNVGDQIPLFKEKKLKSDKNLVIVITSDRGLCGALNSKLLRQLNDDIKDKKENTDLFIVGKKGLDYLSRAGFNVVGTLNVKDDFEDGDLLPLSAYMRDSLKEHKYASVDLYFNFFKNSLIQIPTDLQIYPLQKDIFESFIQQLGVDVELEVDIGRKEIIIEPDYRVFLKEVYRQIRNYIIQSAIVQNKTGEHASRMIAMKNATDNSKDVIYSLTLAFNKARQASVTQEISEIVSAKLAMEDE